jgi:hypothetical protein
MKMRPILFVTGLAMLFALMASPSPLSAYQTPDNAPGKRQSSPASVQPLAENMPALTVNVHVTILTNRAFWFTAMFGGSQTGDAIHTDRALGSGFGEWEVFLLEPQGGNVYAIKTSNGHYLTATAGGGQTGDAIHTDATGVGAWEKFALEPQPDGSFAIKTPNGVNYLTAQDGGARIGDVLHTNSTGIGAWEKFWLVLASPL